MMDAKKVEGAKALADRQRFYDRLHHAKRRDELLAKGKLLWDEREMLVQSNAILEDKSGVFGNRSVDLSDVDYLVELDAYSARIGAPA
jgi:hypothetical protein